jgi:hypothetical protein
MLAGFGRHPIRDPANTLPLLGLVEEYLQRSMPPDGRLVYHIDEDLAGPLAIELDLPVLTARPIAFCFSPLSRNECDLAVADF